MAAFHQYTLTPALLVVLFLGNSDAALRSAGESPPAVVVLVAVGYDVEEEAVTQDVNDVLVECCCLACVLRG